MIAIPTPDAKPIIVIQNRQDPILSDPKKRLQVYQRLLHNRFERAEKDVIKVPRLRGLRLRLPGKPFHSTPEIFFQESGRNRLELPHETMAVEPGDIMIVPARMPHKETYSGSPFLMVVVMFQFENASLHLTFLEDGDMHIGPIDRFHSIDQFAVMRYADEIASVTGRDAVSRRLRQGLYLAMLARLIQGLAPSSLSPPPNDQWIMRCKEIIDIYFCKIDFSVAWLAQQMGCSPDHISRRFRAHTGYRIMEVVHRLRVDHARHLLRDSDMNIAEIAWACGYSQPSYFNRMFKAWAKTTPKELRHGTDSSSHQLRDRRSVGSSPSK